MKEVDNQKTVAVKPCTCENAFQDKEYGKGKRLHNRCGKSPDYGWRCTVCEKVK